MQTVRGAVHELIKVAADRSEAEVDILMPGGRMHGSIQLCMCMPPYTGLQELLHQLGPAMQRHGPRRHWLNKAKTLNKKPG